MITCTLNGKEYHIDFISGRALREIGEAEDMYRKLAQAAEMAAKGEDMPEGMPDVQHALDVMVKWFCLVFGRQFTPDEVYDHYPVDRLMHDIALTLLAVQAQTTEILSAFPTQPTVPDETRKD